ncbi:helix-turn-helix domain-containing protein [Hoeflea poritis]|uniref:Helix-turn-helix domain-containing protein n=1 Tax=Hoeflea poritis TaxID=2993659 RepID=A0ABT4VMI0_9HYPH|nr:helix-turn-helix domain-containing protein [Hoeflea poritis]MDA4845892.1 helix-turn-helix domain-containing protein [Hoeflea poritis]
MTTDNCTVPSIQLDATVVGAKHCYDAWRESVRAVYDVEPAADVKSTTESIKAWLLKELIFSDVSFSPQQFRHCRRLAKDSNYISLQIYKSGRCLGTAGDQTWQVAPGDVHIFDFSREFSSVASKSTVIGCLIPHEFVGYDPARHPAHIMFSGSTPVGQFLASTMFALLSQLPRVGISEADDLSNGFCSLLQGLIEPQLPPKEKERNAGEERRNDMRSYLDRNLSDPNLNVNHLCRVFNISRPSVYRYFAEHGGVAQYIVQRRLKRAYFQLASVPEFHGRVKEVAHGLGFNDAAHFSRLFRRKFGVTPKQAANLSSAGRLSRDRNQLREQSINFSQLSEWIQSI